MFQGNGVTLTEQLEQEQLEHSPGQQLQEHGAILVD